MCANLFLTAAISTHINHIETVGTNFCAMHALYGEIYEWCLEKYDEFGERMATKCIPLETFTYTQKAPRSRDRIIDVGTDLEHLQEALTKAREGLDFLTVTMIDSALITIEKYIWKLRSSR